MRSRPDGAFEELVPPTGGVERLRARIARVERARVRRRRVTGMLVAAPLFAAVVYIALGPAGTATSPLVEFSPTRIGLGLDSVPSEPVTLAPGSRGSAAIQRVSLGTDAVLLYLVGSVE